MTRDDIIRMAKVAERYAGEFCNGIGDTEQHHWFDAYNERFAALVAAAEREACAQVCEEIPYPQQRVAGQQLAGHDYLAAAIRARDEK